MPPFVIVIGIIALLIGAILALRATLTIEYRDALNVSVKVLFLNFKITPRKEKKVDPKDFTPRKFRRMMKKKRRKELRASKKKQKKLEKKALAKKEKQEAKKSGKKISKPSFFENITTVKELVELVCARFTRHLRIKLTRMNVIVASDDAAKTAVLYGVVSQSVAYILEILDRVTNLSYDKEAEVNIDVDFLETKPRADICIAFSLRVWHLLDVAFRALGRFVKLKMKNNNK